MASPHESAITALMLGLTTHPAVILREEDLPQLCPDEGLINLVPEDPEEQGQHLGTGTREWQRRVELECVVQHGDGAVRTTRIDTALSLAAALLVSDSTLGGAVTWLRLDAPLDSDTVPISGAESLRAAVLPVTLFYETSDNPME